MGDSYDYSETQILILQYASYATAPVSMAGSTLIIYVILHGYKQGARNETSAVYHRILLGMSTLDLITSTSILAFGPWAIPQEVTHNIRHNVGNITTCNLSGFFLNGLFGTGTYAAALSLYFLCFIRYEARQEWLAKYVEPAAHILSWGIPIVTGAAALANDLINPLASLPGWCWVSVYPAGCADEAEIECTRGSTTVWAYYLAFTLCGLPMLCVLWMIIITSMVLIIRKVRTIEEQMNNYQFDPNDRPSLERTKDVAQQGLLYIGAYFLTFAPVVGAQIVRSTTASFVFGLMVKTLTVLQGFFFAYIFFRKQLRNYMADGQPLHFLSRLSSSTRLRLTSRGSEQAQVESCQQEVMSTVSEQLEPSMDQ